MAWKLKNLPLYRKEQGALKTQRRSPAEPPHKIWPRICPGYNEMSKIALQNR
jgi:hypothetical protein